MTVAAAGVAGLIGLVVGSFLEVVAERVPRKEPLTPLRHACRSCDAPHTGGDAVPVLSWLRRGGRCRACRGRLGVRAPLLEVACAALFAATAVRFGLSYALPAYLVLGAGLLALSVIDLEHRLLPNRVLFPTGYAVGVLLFLAALAEAEPRRILWAGIGATGCYALFYALHFIYPDGMAFGDVRFSLVLGMAVGWLGLGLVPFFLFTSFVASAAVGLLYAVVSRRGLKVAIPFGPFLAVGAEVAVFVGRRAVDSYLGV